MLKSDFIKEAKELGFEKFKDLVIKLGYHERTLDRVKKDGEIKSKPFLKAYMEYKNKNTEEAKEEMVKDELALFDEVLKNKPRSELIDRWILIGNIKHIIVDHDVNKKTVTAQNSIDRTERKVSDQGLDFCEEKSEIIIHDGQKDIYDVLENTRKTQDNLEEHLHTSGVEQEETKALMGNVGEALQMERDNLAKFEKIKGKWVLIQNSIYILVSYDGISVTAKGKKSGDLLNVGINDDFNFIETKKAEQKTPYMCRSQIVGLEGQARKEIGIDISNEEYHASNKIGSSKLKMMIDNAKEFYHTYISGDIERKETDALTIGKLHHTLVLESHKFDEDYTVLNLPARPVKNDYVEAVEKLGGAVEMRENSKKEMVVANTVDDLKTQVDQLKEKHKKTICTQAQLDIATQTSQKALESWFEFEQGGKTILKAQLKTLLKHSECYVEKTFYGMIDGIEAQARPDILINLGSKNDIWFVIDLKTLEVATPKMFVKQGGAFYWHAQEAFYREILSQNGFAIRNFYFNCAGKKEYSGAVFYEWGRASRENGKEIVLAGMKKYKYCVKSDIFQEGAFDYRNVRFMPISTQEVPAYIQHQFGDMGV